MDSKTRMIVLIICLISSQVTYGQNKSNDTASAKTSFTIVSLCSASYPKKAEENNIEGTVVVQFDIDSTCSYVNFKVIKSLGIRIKE